MGPLQNANFYKGQPTTSATTLATVPAGEDWILDNVVACNNDGSTAYGYTLDVVPSGGTAGVTHRVAAALSVAAVSSSSLASTLGTLGIVMQPGDFLSGLQGTTAKITLWVTGRIRTH
jgi:hypothetical protein